MDVRSGLKRKLSAENWCFWTVVLEKAIESPLDCKEIQPVHPKGNQSWIFIGRTNVEAETPIFWPPYAKSWLIWKDPDVGKDWGQEKKGMTEDEMVRWHHRLYRHGFGWTPEVGDGQGGLVCCNSWGCKELDMTEWLNWTELIFPRDEHSDSCQLTTSPGSDAGKIFVHVLIWTHENLLGGIYEEENCWPIEYVFSSLDYVMPDCSPEWLHQLLLPPALEESGSLFPQPFPPFVCMLSHFSFIWLCDPMDCSPPGSSVHEILQARIL